MAHQRKNPEIYFRNKNQINDIDPGCLWKKDGQKLVLVDDDQYVSLDFEKHRNDFLEVE